MKQQKMYMAYNHNNVKLLKEPTTRAKARKEATEYTLCTGNYSCVKEVFKATDVSELH